MNNSQLAANVKAINNVRSEINRLAPLAIQAFAPLVGQKIIKTDGTLLEKFRHLVPTSNLHVFRISSKYSLGYVVRDCQNDTSGTCVYFEESFYIGEFEGQGQVLTKVYDHEPRRCDFTIEEITAKIQTLKEAKKNLSSAESALHPFPYNSF